MSTQIAKSVEGKVPNFQKDVIYPVIYDLENLKLIQSCAYPESPKNKVIELKKKNIQKIILGIINKPNVSSHSTSNSRYANSSDKSNLIAESKIFRDLVEQRVELPPFEIQIDEQLGELALNMEEDFTPFKERVKRVLQKANHHQKVNQKQEQRIKQVQNFVRNICGPSRLSTPNPDQFKKMSGFLQELDQMSKQKPQSAMRKRAQSAKVLKNNPQSQSRTLHTRRLSQSRMTFSKNLNNDKIDSRKIELNKSQGLFEKINAYYEGQDRDKKRQQASLTKMRSQWDEQGSLQRLVRSKIKDVNPRTLEILRDRRLKQSALNLMDSQYLHL